jgi:antitoxin component of MazEF toxin-antitoxin module
MLKKLTKHGNSLALIIDRPILDLLKINAETALDISTDGTRLIVAPAAAPLARKDRFDAAQEWAHKRYGKDFEKLAK